MDKAEADLIRRWQAGEAAAFEAVARRWQEPLARFLSRLASSDQVPDLLQEVLLRLHRAGPTYRENGHFSTWLFQIAMNVARDAARRQAHATQPLPAEEPAAHGESAEQRCETRELGHLVARAVAELPQPLREVLALRHDRGMKFEEMSRLLGIPASTLKSRFSVALNKLRARLAEWGVTPEGEP
jgi:RNA polymerase sigma-70 factor (ECF subfamily)